MKTYLLLNKYGEIIERKAETETELREWAINHLDLSLNWQISLKG